MWVFESFTNLAGMCERTIKIYSPGLAEYPELLGALERIQLHVEGEQVRWNEFIGAGGDLLPPEALSNLLTLAADALGLTAAISLVLGDWEDLPAVWDSELSGSFWIWPP